MPSFLRYPFSLICAMPLTVLAQNTAPEADLGSGLMQMAVGFGIVLALLLGSLWLLKRISTPHGRSGQWLKIVGAIGIGPRERMVVVEVGDKWLVLGVAPGHVSFLHELPKDATLPPPTTVSLPDFAVKLRQILDRRNAS